ncbi:MAG: UMP kinase [Saccharofermentans sp.]|jgi:uridylate kinase|nr:UMP kinase [Mageeibacillus sp.]MCI1263421.1 UMP kinase [Saccharofermentans sp.]MCI1274874.1 UMP kinase [Saccharofermentans sp.]MCI1769091.1 UMP kinase [Mageeibacillus sp.]MCI2044096.1 UMP kinase [Mageeibacillus sp.]
MSDNKYKRVLLKISGEALAGNNKLGINDEVLKEISSNIKAVADLGVQVAIVVGGGNFWRGRSSEKMDRVTADHMGMLATLMNSLALSDALEQQGAVTRVLSAIEVRQMAEPYIRKRAVRHLEKGRIVIFACGTGNPYFSTDTGAALRATEIGADIFLKATMVDGVYDKDPNIYPDAVKYDRISHDEVLRLNLRVMDSTAAALCRDNHTKILVFSMKDPANIVKIAKGETLGTIVE